jgi:hypothetical protein
MSRFVYFDYRGEFPPRLTFPHPPEPYRYVVQVSKNDCDGGDRDLPEQRRVAGTILRNGLGYQSAQVVANSVELVEIDQARFDRMIKTSLYSMRDGAVFRVIRES